MILAFGDYSPKQMQDHVNSDFKDLWKCLRANKISLNSRKTELLIYIHPNKTINHEI